MESLGKQNLGIAQKIIDDINMEFVMLSQLFYTSTVHSKPSGESKSDVTYCFVLLLTVFNLTL